MNITVDTAEDFVISIICLTGQADKDFFLNLYKDNDQSEKYIYKVLKNLSDEKIISEYQAGGKSYLRLSLLKGDDRARQINKQLVFSLDLLAGRKTETSNNRYKGGKEKSLKRGQISDVILLMLQSDIEINKFSIKWDKKPGRRRALEQSSESEYLFGLESIFDSSGALLKEEQIFIEPDKMPDTFFTSNALRQSTQEKTVSKLMLSRQIGLLVTKERVFKTYYVDKAPFRWVVDTEISSRMRYEQLTSKKGCGLFFAEDENVFDLFLNPQKRTKGCCNPSRVFSESYVLCMKHNPLELLRLVLIIKYETEIISVILKKRGITKGNIISFLSGSIDALIEAGNLLREDDDAKLIVFDWQKESVIKFIKITNRQAEKMLITVSDFEFNKTIKELKNNAGI